MEELRRILLVGLALTLAFAPRSVAAICDIYCAGIWADIATLEGLGVQHGSATTTIQLADFRPLGAFNYVQDEDNGTTFFNHPPVVGVPTVVRRGGVLKVKAEGTLVPVLVTFFDESGEWIPIPGLIPTGAEWSIPAIFLPCTVYFMVVTNPWPVQAQIGQILISDVTENPIARYFLDQADAFYDERCTSGGKRQADLAIVDLMTGENTGVHTLDVGEEATWYNGSDTALTLSFSDGRMVAIPAQAESSPLPFDVPGTITYAVSGFTTQGTVQVGGTVGAPDDLSTPGLALLANSPNPFNPVTRIRYRVPAGGRDVALDVYGAGGRLVRSLVRAHRGEGRHEVVWDGTGDDGRTVASGVYFAVLRAGEERLSRKLLLAK